MGKTILLAHYYVEPELQNIADYVGDSFYLARAASETDADTIIVAGVSFMAESVKILNPDKKVLMIDCHADCPMAHMVTVEKIEEMRKAYKDLAVVTYINSTAEIKAHSDCAVTSSNAVKIVKELENQNIFFVPDRNLGSYVKKQVPEKNIILNDGCCPIHDRVTVTEVIDLKRKYPKAKFMVHPECRKEILEFADYIGSTKGIIENINKFPNTDEFIIGTEEGVLAELYKKYPLKKFYSFNGFICDGMKCCTMDKYREVLKTGKNEITVDPVLAKKAIKPLKRMLELGSR